MLPLWRWCGLLCCLGLCGGIQGCFIATGGGNWSLYVGIKKNVYIYVDRYIICMIRYMYRYILSNQFLPPFHLRCYCRSNLEFFGDDLETLPSSMTREWKHLDIHKHIEKDQSGINCIMWQQYTIPKNTINGYK